MNTIDRWRLVKSARMTTEPTLAQRYDPAPADDRRWEVAIARRNKTWAWWRAAADLLNRMSDSSPEIIRNYNECLDDYERAAADLIRERVIWKAARRPW